MQSGSVWLNRLDYEYKLFEMCSVWQVDLLGLIHFLETSANTGLSISIIKKWSLNKIFHKLVLSFSVCKPWGERIKVWTLHLKYEYWNIQILAFKINHWRKMEIKISYLGCVLIIHFAAANRANSQWTLQNYHFAFWIVYLGICWHFILI